MKYQSLIRTSSGFLRPFRSEIAWRRERLLNTAAAVVDTPVPAKRSSKKVPRAERKALVEAYVNEYRAMNAGKFPGAENTKKQVGGSYYTIRAILQELEHNTELSVTTAGKIATVGGTAERSEISVVEKIEMPAERSSSYLQQNNSDSSERMVDESIRSNGDKITAEDGTLSQLMVDLNLQTQVNRISIVVEDRGDNDEFLGRKEVSEDPSLAEKTSTCHSVKASSTIAHPCEVPVTSRGTEISEIEELSAKASESDDLTRTSNAASSEQRVGSSKVEDDRNPTVGDYHVLMDRAVVNDKVGVSAETGSSSQRVLDNNSCQREVEISEMTKVVERTAKEVSGTDTLIGSPEKTSAANMNWSDKYGNLESRAVTQKSSMVEKTEAVEVIKEDYHESSAKSYYGSKNLGRAISTEHGDESEEFPKKTTTLQKEIVVQKSSLWGNLKSLASDFISIWR